MISHYWIQLIYRGGDNSTMLRLLHNRGVMMRIRVWGWGWGWGNDNKPNGSSLKKAVYPNYLSFKVIYVLIIYCEPGISSYLVVIDQRRRCTCKYRWQ